MRCRAVVSRKVCASLYWTFQPGGKTSANVTLSDLSLSRKYANRSSTQSRLAGPPLPLFPPALVFCGLFLNDFSPDLAPDGGLPFFPPAVGMGS